jgi:hypothetical protein
VQKDSLGIAFVILTGELKTGRNRSKFCFEKLTQQ